MIIPTPAHIEILYDLSFEEFRVILSLEILLNYIMLGKKLLIVRNLIKDFYRELANWYFWAIENVEYPDDVEKDREKRNSSMLLGY